MKIHKLFDTENIDRKNEHMEVLSEFKNSRVERIVSTGQSSDWYDQDEDEFVALLTGLAGIIFLDNDSNEKEIILEAGDSLLIPSNTKHRVSFTSEDEETVWLCFFSK